MIVTILLSEAFEVVASLALFAPNVIFCAKTPSDLLTSAGMSGQPLLLETPATSGHLSSSSLIPSLSLSDTGQPFLLAGPAWLGHLSSSSLIPSPSLSGIGQPSYFAVPAWLGHLSS